MYVLKVDLADTRVGLHQLTAVVAGGIVNVGRALVGTIDDNSTIGTERAEVGGNRFASKDVDGHSLDHPVLHASLGQDAVTILIEVLDVQTAEVVATNGHGASIAIVHGLTPDLAQESIMGDLILGLGGISGASQSDC